MLYPETQKFWIYEHYITLYNIIYWQELARREIYQKVWLITDLKSLFIYCNFFWLPIIQDIVILIYIIMKLIYKFFGCYYLYLIIFIVNRFWISILITSLELLALADINHINSLLGIQNNNQEKLRKWKQLQACPFS